MEGLIIVLGVIAGFFIFLWLLNKIADALSSSKSSSCVTQNGITHCNDSSGSGSSSNSSRMSCTTHNGKTTCDEGFQNMGYASYNRYGCFK